MTLETQKPPPNDKFGNRTPVPEEGNPGTFEKRKKKEFSKTSAFDKKRSFHYQNNRMFRGILHKLKSTQNIWKLNHIPHDTPNLNG
jgi:hypothetical protein